MSTINDRLLQAWDVETKRKELEEMIREKTLALQAVINDKEAAQRDIVQFSLMENELKRSCTTLSEQKTQLEGELVDVTKRLDASQHTLAQYIEELGRLEVLLETNETLCKEKQEALQRLDAEMTKRIQEKQTLIHGHEATATFLAIQHNEMTVDIEKKRRELSKLQQSIQKIQQKHDENEQEAVNLAKKRAQIDEKTMLADEYLKRAKDAYKAK